MSWTSLGDGEAPGLVAPVGGSAGRDAGMLAAGERMGASTPGATIGEGAATVCEREAVAGGATGAADGAAPGGAAAALAVTGTAGADGGVDAAAGAAATATGAEPPAAA